jgi:hypothetical protein
VVLHLQYGRSTKAGRFKRVAALLLLLFVSGVSYRFGPSAGRFVKVLYWHQKGAAYYEPPDRLVFDTTAPGQKIHAHPFPQSWWNLSALVAAPLPPSMGRADPSAPVFLHGMSRGGQEYLVVTSVRLWWNNSKSGPRIPIFDVQVIPPPWRRVGAASYTVWEPSVDGYYLGIGDDTRVRLFAGQPDPGDASKFKIRCDVNGREGYILGHLRNDGGIDFETVGAGFKLYKQGVLEYPGI